jgi:hypothetical protein
MELVRFPSCKASVSRGPCHPYLVGKRRSVGNLNRFMVGTFQYRTRALSWLHLLKHRNLVRRLFCYFG